MERTSAVAKTQIIECSQESEMGLTGNMKSLSKILVDQKFTQAGLFRQDERYITNVHTFCCNNMEDSSYTKEAATNII